MALKSEDTKGELGRVEGPRKGGCSRASGSTGFILWLGSAFVVGGANPCGDSWN